MSRIRDADVEFVRILHWGKRGNECLRMLMPGVISKLTGIDAWKEALLYDLIRVKDHVDSRSFIVDFGWICYAPVLLN